MNEKRDAGTTTGRDLALAGALLAVLIALMLAPRVPDAWGGGLWRWFAGYGAVAIVLRVIWRESEAIARAWSALSQTRRRSMAAIGLALVIVATLAMRATAPDAFTRFSKENGLWEPMCLLTYWGSALLVLARTRTLSSADRRPWLGVALAYAILGLEEIDYFGIFGGIIGRIDGVYAGSLHDLLTLLIERALPGPAWIVIAGLLVAALAVAWRRGFVDPRFIGDAARRREITWLVAGLMFLAIAASEEAHVFGWIAPSPSPEEMIELWGALCLGVYALELVTSGPTIRRSPRSA